MKAVLFLTYGPPEVLRVTTLPDPHPGPGELCIKVHASAVSSGDAHIRRADPFYVRFFFGLRGPKHQVPGYVFAGTVHAVGEGVTLMNEGDRLFGLTGMTFGAMAEFLIISEKSILSPIPEGWSFTEAAAIPFGANTAIYFLQEKAKITSDDRILVHGASGAVGVAAVELASQLGAEVHGLCGPEHLSKVKELGATITIDYTKNSPSLNSYDIVFDAAGKITASQAKGWLKPEGRYVSVNKGYAKDTSERFGDMVALMKDQHLRPVIDQVYPLEDIVEAHRRVDAGHKLGNVIIRVASTGTDMPSDSSREPA